MELDFTPLIRAIRESGQDIGDTAKEALHDVMDEWKAEATDLAPLDKGTLRRNMHTSVTATDDALYGEIHANAVESSAKWPNFNYAYYLHEVKKTIKNPTTPGTVADFLDVPVQRNEDKWMKEIEEAIKQKLKGNGF